MQKFQDDPHVVYARSLVEKGAKVVCVEDGLPTWVAEVSPCVELYESCQVLQKTNSRTLASAECVIQACLNQGQFCLWHSLVGYDWGYNQT